MNHLKIQHEKLRFCIHCTDCICEGVDKSKLSATKNLEVLTMYGNALGQGVWTKAPPTHTTDVKISDSFRVANFKLWSSIL